jgi:hypothetical protein
MTQETDWAAPYRYWDKTNFNPYVKREDLTAIGEIVVIWGQIEAQIQALIWGYCGLSLHKGMVVTGSLPLHAKRQLLSTLVQHYETQPTRASALNRAIKEIENLQSKRNTIVHGLWMLEAPLEYKKLGVNPQGPKSEPLKINLHEFAVQSGNLYRELERLYRESDWKEIVAALPDVEFSAESNVFMT